MKTYPMMCHIRAQGGTTRIDVYDDIGDGGLFGEGVSAKDFAAQLSAVKGPLDVHINSYGGSVKDGVAITSAIRDHQGPKRTIVDGMAASAASVIMQAGDERIVQPGAMVMIHDASMGCMGNAADMQKAADELNKHSDNIASIYARRAGGTPDQWRDAMRQESWYTADEAVDAGLADKVGTGTAALPSELDLAAFASIPDRVVAQLRTLPLQPPHSFTVELHDAMNADVAATALKWLQAKAATRNAALHAPFTGTHTHPHSAMGSQGADGTHEHEHSHDGDADHAHSHPTAHVSHEIAAAATGPYEPIPYRRDPDENVCCPQCEKYNDPDARFCDQCGAKLIGRDDVTTDDDATARARTEVTAAAAIDQSAWDGPKAMSLAAKSDDPAATYKEICAGHKAGDPSKQDSWALPYRYPGKGPNAAGVRNALARLPQTDDLTNKAQAQALLEGLMKQINPDYDPDAGNRAPSWIRNEAAAVPAWLNPPKEANK